jgi:hypothetical protein
MVKRMKARFKGVCCRSGALINVGDEIMFNTVTRQAWITVDNDRLYYIGKQ